MSGWTVWLCCQKFEVCDSKEEAFEEAWCYDRSDNGHMVQRIEGPNGEDLTKEFGEYSAAESKRDYEEWKARSAEAERKLLGSVEVKSPGGSWYGERVYSEAQRDEQLAEMRAAYGMDRVRFTKKPRKPGEHWKYIGVTIPEGVHERVDGKRCYSFRYGSKTHIIPAQEFWPA